MNLIGMSHDMTFCTSEKCLCRNKCKRHNKNNKFSEGELISFCDFSENKEIKECDYYIKF